MKVSTAVFLATGAAVGFLFGMGVEEKTKERIASYVRGKIFYALTGEELPKKKPVAKTYENYMYNRYKDIWQECNSVPKPLFNWEELKKELLEFDTIQEAHGFIARMNEIAEKFKTISLYDACFDKRVNFHRSYMDYGWTEEEVDEWGILEKPQFDGTKRYRVTANEPEYFHLK